MAQATAIRLTGEDLRIDDVWAVAFGAADAALSDESRTKMRAARSLVERAAHGTSEHTYGINTGFGRFVSQSIPEDQTDELQLRLLRSHACGVGDPYPDEIVRAAMLLRANALAKGNSGARVETVELLLECLGRGVLPYVPSRGSVGASGDLAPLAHLALPLVGEGEAWLDGEVVSGADALAAAGLEPTRLAAKEGLSLVNGTQFMAAFGALGVLRARRLAKTADLACALSLEALQGSRTSFIPQIHRLRPLRGQGDSAANVLLLLEGSAINESHKWCDKVQDAYSLRCAPQVHGASRDLLAYVEGTVAVELNAATDNPLVLVEDELLVSNGNFHGQPLAFALDALAMASSELASISERRVERLVNPNLSDGLPAFLTVDGGLNSGFMIPQYVAASLVSENKSLCHPASVDSIPTSAGQEDHVSMGNAAGLKAWQVVANSERALAIELLAGAQAVEFLAPLEPGHGVRATHGFVRSLSQRLGDDRPLSRDIERVAGAIRDGSLVEAVEAEVGELA
ncbi:MAG: histidine ammonia-lyase [Gaiellaceae bacterium]|nr:histidine ammonia-lyase [Gaiellaceae bacterium]